MENHNNDELRRVMEDARSVWLQKVKAHDEAALILRRAEVVAEAAAEEFQAADKSLRRAENQLWKIGEFK